MTDVSIDAILIWEGGDPDVGDIVTYDLYFGTDVSPPQIVYNQSELIYDPELDYNTTYFWIVVAWDDHDEFTTGPLWSFSTLDTGGNQPPSKPLISGPTIGGAGIEFNFTISSSDPEEDQIYYNITWGDDTFTNWIGPYNSSENITVNNAWDNYGEYEIKVKAKDSNGSESNWSITHLLSVSAIIQFDNIEIGFLYFRLHLFEKESFMFLNILEQLGFSIVIGTDLFDINISDLHSVVDCVKVNIYDAIWDENITMEDNNASDGFSMQINLLSGIYEINASAYDSEGNLIDKQNLSYVVNICIKSSSDETQGPISRVQQKIQNFRQRRGAIRQSILERFNK
jgi:hypothetical protein